MSHSHLTMFYSPERYIKIVREVDALMHSHPKLAPVFKEKDRYGGFFCVADLDGNPRLVTQIGDCDPQKLKKYLELCQEKVARLAAHPDHLLSRQSEDESRDMFPGAVRGNRHLFGFSGYPGHIDELEMIAVATRAGELTRSQVGRILELYPNKYASPDTNNLYYL